MSDEEWVKEAMADDAVVVELLIHLNNHAAAPSKRGSPTLPLHWSVRQRRSKPILQAKKPTARASPTTPLSWSGGGATSVSGGSGGGVAVDGSEESSRTPPKRSDDSRSKLNATSETTATKRSRKKKTLAELKNEEILLAKERRHLKRELANLRVNLEKQRANNESLKRLKLDLQLQPVAERVPTVALASEQQTSDQMHQNVVAYPIPSILPPIIIANDLDTSQKFSPPLGSSETQVVVKLENKFFLPDLNMPLEDESSSDLIRGTS